MPEQQHQRLHPGIWVRKHVLPSGMTVAEAARRLGVGRPALSNFLNGRAALSHQMARRLERTFGADAAAVLERQARYDAETTARGRQPVVGSSFAPSVTTIKAAQIAAWADRIEARQHLAVLLRKLVHGTGTKFSRVDFPGYDSSERPGWDGWVATTAPTAWIPDGESGWEFGCSNNPAKKANSDFDARLGVPDARRRCLTFVFVTPRRWPGKRDWEAAKRDLRAWRDVRAYDADDLEQWVEQCVPAQVWFAEQLGQPLTGLVSLDEYWRRWAEATDPPLPRALFQAAVEEYSGAFQKWLESPGDRPFTIAADSRAEAVALVARLMDHPRDTRELVHRGVVFENSEAVQRLASGTPGAFVAVAANLGAERSFPALARSLHRVVPVPRNGVWPKEHEPAVRLGPLGCREFGEALSTTDLSRDQIMRLSRDSGRSPTVLRRCLSTLPDVSRPPWADAGEAEMLGPLCLIGVWNTASEGDRRALSRLAASDHETAEVYVARTTGFDDAPVWSVGEYRGVVSRSDSFFATVSFWTPDLVGRFFRVVEDVLMERDPALDLPEEEQWAAAIFGKARRHSAALRDGLCEALVMLAVHGPAQLDARLGMHIGARVVSVVRRVLQPFDPDRLRSLDQNIPDLAEAAPEVFLDAVEADLASGDSVVAALMHESESWSPKRGRPRANLLWALERLAWEPDHYPRVVEILAGLSSPEITDGLGNRPEVTLRYLFHAWIPQTTASVRERIKALKTVTRRHPEVGWALAYANERSSEGLFLPSQRPSWRGDASAYRNRVSGEEANLFLRAARSICLNWPRHDHRTLRDLVRVLSRWEEEDRERVFQLVEDWAAKGPADEELAALCEGIRKSQRRLGVRHGALSSALGSLLERLGPQDPVLSGRWLFKSDWGLVHDYQADGDDVDLEEATRVVREWRLAALRLVLDASGLAGVGRLLQQTGAQSSIGRLLAELLQTSDQRWSLVSRCLDEAGPTDADPYGTCLRSFLSDQESSVIRELWLEIAPSGDSEARQRFLGALTYGEAVRLLEASSGEVRSRYWREFTPRWERLSADQRNEVIAELLQANRPHTALAVAEQRWKDVPSSRLVDLLETVAKAELSAEDARVVGSSLSRAFRSLANRPDVSEEKKALLELMFFGALRSHHYPMQNLARQMSASPLIFVEAVARCRKREDGREDPPRLRGEPETRRVMADTAFRLLEWFERIPGADDNGSVAAEPLMSWLGEARSSLRQLGRGGVGDRYIGKLFGTVPSDGMDIWPCREICTALERIGGDDLAGGFVAGRVHGRGFSLRPVDETGERERRLAVRHRAWATAMAHEFPYVARLLREIARYYDVEITRRQTSAELRERGVE